MCEMTVIATTSMIERGIESVIATIANETGGMITTIVSPHIETRETGIRETCGTREILEIHTSGSGKGITEILVTEISATQGISVIPETAIQEISETLATCEIHETYETSEIHAMYGTAAIHTHHVDRTTADPSHVLNTASTTALIVEVHHLMCQRPSWSSARG